MKEAFKPHFLKKLSATLLAMTLLGSPSKLQAMGYGLWGEQ
jgi:hypothetical protein